MPYPLSLQSYTKPEFYEPAPQSWEDRLREISPVTSNMAHLGFRKFEARPDWSKSPFNDQPDRPLWAVYTRTPRAMVSSDRAALFEKHWSEVPNEGDQVALRTLVSEYQFFMWTTQGVDVFPLWLLQGEWGGTPMKYTKRETAYLRGSGAETAPYGPGLFTPCPFNERAVQGILARDRLLKASNRYDELEKMDRSEAKKAEDDAAELLYRETYLDSLSVLMAPSVEFMRSQLAKRQIDDAVAAGHMRPAPTGLANTLATWKDVWRQTGTMPNASTVGKQKVQVAVK